MRRQRKKKEFPQIEFWQSATDLSLVLSMIFLLVIAVLLLYLFRLPEQQQFELWGTESNLQDATSDHDDQSRRDDYNGDYANSNYNDNQASGGGETDSEFHERYPVPSSGGEDWNKAAVYVTVVDAETMRAIREPGITFELYESFDDSDDLHGALRYLYTYYPEKIEYKNFETTKDGTYYLPEKIQEGLYYFKEITAPEGYDSAGTISFNLDNTYDWNDPYVVSVPLYPSKNIIRVRLLDADTGASLAGGTFRVDAAEDIVTVDGTVRYAAGAQADTITVEADGGTSKELYLGNYKLYQSTAPRYYTTVPDVVDVSIAKKDGKDPAVYEFYCEKTAYTVQLRDDLTGAPLEGAGFSLLADGTVVQTAATDASGTITFTSLEKNQNYTVKQTSTTGDYRMSSDTYSFFVDASGQISGQAKASLSVTNYVPRVEISLKDIVTKKPVTGKTIFLFNSSDEQLYTWTTSGVSEQINGLNEGSYYVQIGNNTSARYNFTVQDSGTITTVALEIWSASGILTITGAVLLFAAVVFLIAWIAARARKRRKSKEETP